MSSVWQAITLTSADLQIIGSEDRILTDIAPEHNFMFLYALENEPADFGLGFFSQSIL